MSQESKIEILKKRAELLSKVRSFFYEKDLLEVDCPSLLQYPSIDAYIDPFTVGNRYLHTSPEFAMKRLLAKGSPDIYQISHVYRKEEIGSSHLPEFTLIEWYKKNIDFDSFISHVLEFLTIFIKNKEIVEFTYRKLFLHYLNIDPFHSSIKELEKLLDNVPKNLDKDSLLQLILHSHIEPQMKDKIFVIKEFPPTQAALARIENHRAKRFEIYCGNLELLNGYHELNDPAEQEKRFIKENQKRKIPLPTDKRFLSSLKNLPDCCGVAAGFDRLCMLHLDLDSISDVVPFSWNEI